METVYDLKFPVIGFNKHTFYIERDVDSLTVTTKAGLKNKLYENASIIDSSGRLYTIVKAKKLHGIGLFWGYNVFLNQRIKIELYIDPIVTNISLDDFKKRVTDIFDKDKYFWNSGGNLKGLRKMVLTAGNHEEIIRKLGAYMEGK